MHVPAMCTACCTCVPCMYMYMYMGCVYTNVFIDESSVHCEFNCSAKIRGIHYCTMSCTIIVCVCVCVYKYTLVVFYIRCPNNTNLLCTNYCYIHVFI